MTKSTDEIEAFYIEARKTIEAQVKGMARDALGNCTDAGKAGDLYLALSVALIEGAAWAAAGASLFEEERLKEILPRLAGHLASSATASRERTTQRVKAEMGGSSAVH